MQTESFAFSADHKVYGIDIQTANERVTAREFDGTVCE